MNEDIKFMKLAISMAEEGMDNNAGGPFGTVIVKDGKVIAKACNKVTSSNDPTAHAEIVAIREACKELDTFQLEGCTVYTSCEPCPMCLGAIYWARPDRVIYACDRHDAAKISFDDQFIYDEIDQNISDRKITFDQILRDEAISLFKKWTLKEDRTEY